MTGAVPGKGVEMFAAVSAMVLSAACWGFATVMSKGALAVFSPPVLLTFQLTASVGFLWLSVGLTRQRFSLKGNAR